MKLLSVKIRGAIGFKKGLGVDDVDLDLSKLSGLIGISGPNGLGKTTLLECMSPYRTFASRSGSLKHHFGLRDSHKDITFSFNGSTYRTLVKIDSDSDRSEGFIWKDDEPQVNGKVSEYDRYLNALLGSPTLFYSSVFCAQNSDRMSDMTTGDLKKLFAEFLRLDRLSGYEETAKKCIGVLYGLKAQAEKRIEPLRAEVGKLNNIEGHIAEADTLMTQGEKQIEDVERSITILNETVESLKKTIANNEVNAKRQADLTKSKQAIIDENIRDKEDTEKELEAIRVKIRGINADIETCDKTLALKEEIDKASQKISQYTVAIKNNKDLVATEQKSIDEMSKTVSELMDKSKTMAMGLKTGTCDGVIEQLSNEILNLEDIVAAKRKELDSLYDTGAIEADKKAKDDLDKTIQGLESQKQSLASNGEVLAMDSKIESMKKQAEILCKRPEPCRIDTCPFIENAIESKQSAETLQAARDALQKKLDDDAIKIDADLARTKEDLQAVTDRIADYEKRQAEDRQSVMDKIASFQTEIVSKKEATKKRNAEIEEENKVVKDKIKEADQEVAFLNDSMTMKRETIEKTNLETETFERLIESLNATLEKRSELEVAQSKKADLTKRKEELTAEGVTINTALTGRIDARKIRLEDLNKDLEDVAKQLDFTAKVKLEGVQRDITLKAEDKKALSASLESVKENRFSLLQRKRESEKAAEDIQVIQAEIAGHDKEISEWTYLAVACSKNGLQAMEIDGVAPLITGYANKLLSRSFGPLFTVKLVTVDPETEKEVLDIVVIREDGSEVLVDKLSGGQQVWVLKALRLAMTLVNKEKSERAFQTILADEEDGALDEENAMNFINLYRSIMGAGDFDDCFFISHTPPAISMADCEIRFSPEGITLH